MLRALLFDLDGTLVDTEPQTAAAIAAVMGGLGHPGVALPPSETSGRSWADIAKRLCDLYMIQPPPKTLEDELLHTWNRMVAAQATPLPGARLALTSAARLGFRLGVVSSSPRSVIHAMLQGLDLDEVVPQEARIGADDVQRYKPDPEGYLRCAARLEVSAEECLVFEDSSSGLRAARSAGMLSVAVLGVSYEREAARALADFSMLHYESLPAGFFEALRRSDAPRLTLRGLLS